MARAGDQEAQDASLHLFVFLYRLLRSIRYYDLEHGCLAQLIQQILEGGASPLLDIPA